MIQRAREELDRERRNLLRRRPNCEVKEKPPKTPNSKSQEQKIVLVHLSFKMKVVMMV